MGWLFCELAWYAEFLLEIDLKILLKKTGARLIFKIALISLHIDPEVESLLFMFFCITCLTILSI
jgi:hypothetical protein